MTEDWKGTREEAIEMAEFYARLASTSYTVGLDVSQLASLSLAWSALAELYPFITYAVEGEL